MLLTGSLHFSFMLSPKIFFDTDRLQRHIVAHQLVLGSYPAVYLAADYAEKVMLLNDLVEALILRDVSDLFKIKRVDAFRKLLALLAGQIGNLVNFSELASICNVDVGTINAYIEILEESHIVKKPTRLPVGSAVKLPERQSYFFPCLNISFCVLWRKDSARYVV
jgi:predicted AAA+ superfamily ATPase